MFYHISPYANEKVPLEVKHHTIAIHKIMQSNKSWIGLNKVKIKWFFSMRFPNVVSIKRWQINAFRLATETKIGENRKLFPSGNRTDVRCPTVYQKIRENNKIQTQINNYKIITFKSRYNFFPCKMKSENSFMKSLFSLSLSLPHASFVFFQLIAIEKR